MVVIAAALAQEVEVVEVQAPDRSLEAETTASVVVVEVDERFSSAADLASVIGSVPGVALRRLGGMADASQVSLRGSTARQVEVFLDGVPLNPDGVGAVDLSELPLHAFTRIEVFRGNTPVGLGTPMGGAINLVTTQKPATAFSALVGTQKTARVQGLLQRQWGPVETFFTLRALSTSGRFRHFVQNAPVVVEDDAWSVRENNDARLADGIARLRIGPVALTQMVHGREEGVPGFTGAPLKSARLETVQSSTTLGVGQEAVRGRVTLQRRVETLRDPAEELVGEGRFAAWILGAQVRARFSRAPWWKLTGVVSGRVEEVEAQGRRWIGRAEVGAWFRRGGLRLEPAIGVLSGVHVLPRMGASYTVGKTIVKANVGYAVRPPDLLELYGNRGPLVGRPDLRAERGVRADLGLYARGQWGSAAIGGFANESIDLITYIQNAQGAAVPTNLGRTGVHGLEGALSLQGWLSSETNATLQRSVNRTEDYRGQRLPRQPLFQLDQRTGLRWRWLRLGHTLSLTTGVITDPLGQRRQPARVLMGAFVRAELAEGVQLSLDVQNLLDTKTMRVPLNPLDRQGVRGPTAVVDFVGYPLPGRTAFLVLRYQAP